MRRLFLSVVLLLAAVAANAQTTWYDPMECEYDVIQNQAFTSEIKGYSRLPKRAEGKVRGAVWGLAKQSAGLSITFFTNSPQIEVRYETLDKSYAMPHMPSTGKSGIDLYRIDQDGVWDYVAANSYRFGSELVSYRYYDIVASPRHGRGYEYRIYLPLYNGIKKLEIGVNEGCDFRFAPTSQEKPIVLYGTSIAQGGCASRPAMAWGSIIQRSIDMPLINFGFSGNGPMETEVLDFIVETDARLYILDCYPNMTNAEYAQKVYPRTLAAVKQIRAKHDEPILIVEHAGYSDDVAHPGKREIVDTVNMAARRAFEELKADGVKDIYYLTRKELAFTQEMTVDGTHPTDLGMMQQAQVVEKKVREILKMTAGSCPTMQAVTQRREPHIYEWDIRHNAIISEARERQPEAVILGNSIVHYWGGAHKNKNGEQVWNDKMAKFVNMGCGWDRIENLLWRVYHGELDGFKAKKVVVMIGVNNLGHSSDADIVAGVRNLLAAVKSRQPEAEIVYAGILPCRNNEQRVKSLNEWLRSVVTLDGHTFINPGVKLLGEDGKIVERYFKDGLHPNNDGYSLIVDEIAR
ncbi:MAG: SGNH/GDSL hydrolase family protein [Alistipes sp.]|nr:SGNH/GDSL hydrolase family protein [Alistipes sp.]